MATEIRQRPHHGRGGIWRWWLPLGASGLLAACSGGEPRTPTYTVQGAVQFKGKPAAGAFVVFHPLDATAAEAEAPRPMGLVNQDGSFRLTTHEEDGAPAGEYAVTVQWHRLVVDKGESESRPGPNVLPPRYGAPQSTPLKVTVRQGVNALPPLRIETR